MKTARETIRCRRTHAGEDDLLVEFIKLWTNQVPALPLVYNTDIIPVSNKVTGIVPRSITGINALFN
jgi:hypothetical protein